ncbi:hypothetical protein TRFO_21730 [Tritrichomonas foetus]|uniref:Uncharacterized protein n=1 Tax=Tritrichomonas foetus TaxID=1144522 RepID=A0A1J4KHN9_9EUKA|nr:hypothetical protein TRFO_21730 [Tritrichomonas foetus]|eukprot:OHT09340.1 hypothetical protein TRFO_21730 [Tritrichomonas foetus]
MKVMTFWIFLYFAFCDEIIDVHSTDYHFLDVRNDSSTIFTFRNYHSFFYLSETPEIDVYYKQKVEYSNSSYSKMHFEPSAESFFIESGRSILKIVIPAQNYSYIHSQNYITYFHGTIADNATKLFLQYSRPQMTFKNYGCMAFISFSDYLGNYFYSNASYKCKNFKREQWISDDSFISYCLTSKYTILYHNGGELTVNDPKFADHEDHFNPQRYYDANSDGSSNFYLNVTKRDGFYIYKGQITYFDVRKMDNYVCDISLGDVVLNETGFYCNNSHIQERESEYFHQEIIVRGSSKIHSIKTYNTSARFRFEYLKSNRLIFKESQEINISFRGYNYIQSTKSSSPGILCSEGSSINLGKNNSEESITTHDSYLEVEGGLYSSGIGTGRKTSYCKRIGIYGGRIKSIGGEFGSGIGCGFGEYPHSSNVEEIKICGSSQVTSIGGRFGSGIGSGFGANYDSSNVYRILISSNCTINATSIQNGSGIGSGYGGNEKSSSVKIINITGCNFINSVSLENGAGIGSGFGGFNNSASVDSIIINKCNINATSLSKGAGIGSGYGYKTYASNVNSLIINNSNVTSQSRGKGSGIGGGCGHGINSSRIKNILINNSNITSTGSDHSSGIGSGQNSNIKQIEILNSHCATSGGSSGIGYSGTGIVKLIFLNYSDIKAIGRNGAGIGGGFREYPDNDLNDWKEKFYDDIFLHYKHRPFEYSFKINTDELIWKYPRSKSQVIRDYPRYYSEYYHTDNIIRIIPKFKNITMLSIYSCNISAKSLKNGAGIGCGYNSCPSFLMIDTVGVFNGNYIDTSIFTNGSEKGSGIGTGSGFSHIYELKVYGQNINATGGKHGAGIGTSGTPNSIISHLDVNLKSSHITGGDYGAGIGTGKFGFINFTSISGQSTEIKGGKYGSGIGLGLSGIIENLHVKGSINTTGGEYGAGIGGGSGNKPESHIGILNILGGDQNVNPLRTIGGEKGTGIGGGFGNSENSSFINEIYVSGGFISSQGGKYGSGLGGGYGKSYNSSFVNFIFVSCGTHDIKGGYYGSGIGGGYGGNHSNDVLNYFDSYFEQKRTKDFSKWMSDDIDRIYGQFEGDTNKTNVFRSSSSSYVGKIELANSPCTKNYTVISGKKAQSAIGNGRFGCTYEYDRDFAQKYSNKNHEFRYEYEFIPIKKENEKKRYVKIDDYY